MNTDTTATVASSSTDQVIGQAIIGLATWVVIGTISTYIMSISVLMAMIISIAVSLITALRGTDQAVGARTRGFFSGFAKTVKA